VDEAGRVERHVNTVRADGRERVSGSSDGYSLRAAWRDARTLETEGRKDGRVIGGAVHAVATDHRTLTITADRQRIVLHRTPIPADSTM
jgi:hypothetical protein